MHFARLRPAAARFLIGAIGVVAVVPVLGQALTMNVHPVFDGLKPGAGVVPLQVDLSNTGPDARGVVQVSVGTYSMSYPVELPQGTRKKLITYPDCGEYAGSGLEYALLTNKGHFNQTVEANGYMGSGQFVIGEISENGGDLGFLRSASRDYAMMAPQDVYVKPANAPDRPTGYSRLAGLVLGDGAERLSDDAVRAIKTWALGGGTLIFIGGASAPILNDARWSSTLPVHDATQQNFGGSKALEKRYGSSPKPFTAMLGKPVKSALTRADGLIMERPFGLGRAVYLAFNPFENPLIGWSSRPKLFTELLSPTVITGPQMVINTVVSTQPVNPYSGRYSYSYPDMESTPNNPFRATLPSATKVLLILTCYFLAVVPLNFLVLRKLKRGELAWGTAPILSLAFAGVFFAAAQGLYSAKMSTSTKGILIAQEGEPNALVLGYSQIYFPHGGRYDLKLTGVDSLIQTDMNQPYMRREEHSVYEDLDPVDVGQIQGTISVPNLAFREMTYRQSAQTGGWFDVHRLADGRFSITNNTDFVLVNARLVGGGGWKLIGDLQPHRSTVAAFDQQTTSSEDLPSRLGSYLIRSRGLALTGRVKGMRAGPLIGDEVKDSAGLTLAFLTNEQLKPSEMLRTTGDGEVFPQ